MCKPAAGRVRAAPPANEEGASEVTPCALCSAPGVAPTVAPCPLGLRFPLTEGRAWACPSQLLAPSPKLWQQWRGSPLPGSLRTPPCVPPDTPQGKRPQNRVGMCHIDPHAGGDRLPGGRALLQGRGLVRRLRPWKPLERPHFGSPELRDARLHTGVWKGLGAMAAGWGGTGPQFSLGK